MALTAPEKMNFSSKNFTVILQGLPGVGKTTIALSAPKVMICDTDEGMCRINPEHRKTASFAKTYEELREDLESAKGKFETVVIDTAGALIDMLKDWAVRNGNIKKDGTISLQGYGVVKREFITLSRELRKNFNVIYVFHAEKTKNGEDIFYDIVCEGAAKSIVYQPADIAGFVQIIGDKRYIGFSPTAQYNAKSAYGIKGLIEVPELKPGEPNDFMTKLFDQMRKNLEKESSELTQKKEAYDEAMEAGMITVNSIEKPEDVKNALAIIKGMQHSLTSEKELISAVTAKLKSLGIVYDKESKAYKYKEN